MPTLRSRRNLPLSALAGLVLVLAGCGGAREAAESSPAASPLPTSTVPGAPSATPADTTPTNQDVREIAAQIADGTVRTGAETVEVASGEAIRIVVTSDVDDELHVHGVDKTAVLVAGEPTSVALVFDEPGVYEVETHDGGLLLFQLQVR
jgi:plastocyanin